MSISHILQKIAGKDIDLLDRSSDAERTMYNCLGILVILISLLTLVSISFALFLVHFPNGLNPYVSHSLRDYLNLLFIVLLTFVWTLIVFNFYRFSLSSVSTLKQKFTLDLIPRLVIQLFFGILIGVSISLPLAVVVGHHEFKDDI
jgi:magnesium-transporting ATPase (P-type)